MIKNLLLIQISNNYENSENFLESVSTNVENFKNLTQKLPIKYKLFLNKENDDLLNEIKLIDSDDIEFILLFYSGHGYDSNNNNFVGIIDKNGNYLNMLALFNCFKKTIFCVFDGCRGEAYDQSLNKENLNQHVIIAFPCEKGLLSYGNPKYGTFLTFGFIETIFLYQSICKKDFLTSSDLLNIYFLSFKYYKQKWNKIPKIYSNRQMMDSDIFNKISKITIKSSQDHKTEIEKKIINLKFKRKLLLNQISKFQHKKAILKETLDEVILDNLETKVYKFKANL